MEMTSKPGMTKPCHPEIGRELKVSELCAGMLVCVHKGNTVGTMFVLEVDPKRVFFGTRFGGFIARRVGDGITDHTNKPMAIYSYLGRP
jgi:hypothetical protein